MRDGYRACIVIATVAVFSLAARTAVPAAASLGEREFMEHCAVCHPGGGNIIDPALTLGKKDLAAGGILTAADIVAKMRKPGPGMTQFDAKTISDREAKAIAEYILKTFK